MTGTGRDHGGGLDAAAARWGGTRGDWLDLSTGINPVPYPVGTLPADAWTALPDADAMDRLLRAARRFWTVPDGATLVAANGASALIARLPELSTGQSVAIPGPTYNEHEAAFRRAGRQVNASGITAPDMQVVVHPNNPDGRLHDRANVLAAHRSLSIIDESFCDERPQASHVDLTARDGILVLKSFGKFWGLAGLRLGFAIATPKTLTPLQSEGSSSLHDMLGPWAVSGPALHIGAQALSDDAWAETTRMRLTEDAARLDALLTAKGARALGGTTLFRLFEVEDAAAWQDRLARGHVWSRIFPYNPRWLRLGLPAPTRWDQLAQALA